MKQSGLRNRFSQAVRYVWLYWYACMVCGKNQQDNLHHIVSPPVHGYVDGKHNESVYNSCPIHNRVCHIGNETWLTQHVGELLWKTRDALEELGYSPNALDREFLKVYAKLYAR